VQAGQLGNYLETIVPVGSKITLTTTGTVYNVATLVLTAGTWLVNGSVFFGNGTADSLHLSWVGSQTLPAYQDLRWNPYTLASGSDGGSVPVLKVTGATTVYLCAYTSFSGTSPTAYGHISAFRMTAF